MRSIRFGDKLYNAVWSCFLYCCGVLFWIDKNVLSQSERAQGVFDLAEYLAILSMILIVVLNIIGITKKIIRSKIFEVGAASEISDTTYDVLKEALNTWIESNKQKLKPVSQKKFDDHKIRYFYRLMHSNISIPYPTRIWRLIVIKNWGILLGWVWACYIVSFGILKPLYMLMILICHQVFSSEINRRVLYWTAYFSIRRAILYLAWFGLFGGHMRIIAGYSLSKFDEKPEPTLALPEQNIQEQQLEELIENKYLKTIITYMESNPPKQEKGKVQQEKDLNRCLKHIGILRPNNEGIVPFLSIVESRGTFGANIITVNTETVPGLTLNKLSAKKDEIENFLNWDGLRFERDNRIGHVNIVVPYQERKRILTRDMLEMPEYHRIPVDNYPVPIGLTLEGTPIYAELSNPITPHFLIGGGTGSGKSYLANSILFSLLNAYDPSDFLLGIIDPKGSEFINFSGYPHVVRYVDNDFSRQLELVTWAETEMNRRNTQVFAPRSVKNLSQWNARYPDEKLPRIMIVIDEYADIVTDKDQKKEFEPVVMRLAAKARSAGIHLMLLTQKPSADTVNTTLRSNLGCRIALRMSDANSYRTILNNYDNTVLAGKGDMLVEFADRSYRLQGSCLTSGGEEEEEVLIKKCKKFWKSSDWEAQLPPAQELAQIECAAEDKHEDLTDPEWSQYSEIEKKLILIFSEYACKNAQNYIHSENGAEIQIPYSREELRSQISCGKAILQEAVNSLIEKNIIKSIGIGRASKTFFCLPLEKCSKFLEQQK